MTKAADIDILTRLAAIESIRVLKARYCRYVDTKDWLSFADLFTRDAQLCFPENNPEWVSVELFVPAVEKALAGGITVHHAHSPEISFESRERASAVWAMQDRLFFPPGVEGIAGASRIAGAGHYHESYRLENGQWLFERIRLTRLHLAVEAQARVVA
jgi:hypothetical protein